MCLLKQLKFLDEYLRHLTFERNLSALTRENYARDINLLHELADGTEFNALEPQQIRRFIGTLNGRGLSGKSIARALSAWRSFYHYLIGHHGFAQNPVLGLRAPKSPKSLPHAMSTDQVVKFVNITDDGVLSVRDHAICELFYSSGLRLSELVNIDLGQLDFADGTITVTGKGNKTRIVPMGSHAISAIQTWLEKRSLIKIAEATPNALFVTQQGKRITPRAVQYRLKTWAIKQDINTNVHPHMLRHSFASHVLQSSQDLRAVQEMLGHANISSTQIYTHLDFQHLATIYDKTHPRAKKS
jgi:integrase/recombinase XerC